MKFGTSCIKGIMLGKVIKVSFPSITKAIGCLEEGNFYNRTREELLGAIRGLAESYSGLEKKKDNLTKND